MKIFVASTGRCGTYYMAQVMQRLSAVPSRHEPKPYCNEEVCREVNDEDTLSEPTVKELGEKVSQVAIDSRRGFYFESNQMFIKSYYELMLERFDDVYAVYLWRNPLDYLMSCWKKFEHQELDWFLQPHWQKNLMRAPAGMSFYEIALWQWYEVRARWLEHKHLFVDTFDFAFDDLNNRTRWRAFFEQFKIPHNDFDELPPVGKNGIYKTEGDVLEGLRRDWNKSGVPSGMVERGYKTREDLIDWAKKTIATNRADINAALV